MNVIAGPCGRFTFKFLSIFHFFTLISKVVGLVCLLPHLFQHLLLSVVDNRDIALVRN